MFPNFFFAYAELVLSALRFDDLYVWPGGFQLIYQVIDCEL